MVSPVAGSTVPDFKKTGRAATALGQSVQRGASEVDVSVSSFQILIDRCDFSQPQASELGNSTFLSLSATSNVLIRDCVFRSANAISGLVLTVFARCSSEISSRFPMCFIQQCGH